jgi:hypothetical protein
LGQMEKKQRVAFLAKKEVEEKSSKIVIKV